RERRHCMSSADVNKMSEKIRGKSNASNQGDNAMKSILLTVPVLLLAQLSVEAAVKTETVTYQVGNQTFKGYLAWDDAVKGNRPGVLVFPEWWGVNDYAKKRAEQLAGMGYVALAADMYGDGKTTEHPME